MAVNRDSGYAPTWGLPSMMTMMMMMMIIIIIIIIIAHYSCFTGAASNELKLQCIAVTTVASFLFTHMFSLFL